MDKKLDIIFEEIEKEEYDLFTQNHYLGNLLQSYNWGDIKKGWIPFRYGIRNTKTREIIGSYLILKKQFPMGLSMLYLPRGAVLDYNDNNLVKLFTEELKRFSKQEKAIFVKLDPLILRNTYEYDKKEKIFKKNIVHDTNKLFHMKDNESKLLNNGYIYLKPTLEMSDTIQPRFQAVVYKEDFSLEKLSKKTRQLVRTSKNRGVSIEKFSSKDTWAIEKFSEIMSKTADRKNINLRNSDYFKELMLNIPNSTILMGKINLKERYDMVVTEYHEILTKEKTGEIKKYIDKKISLEKEKEQLEKDIYKYGEEDIYISCAMLLPYGKSSELLYAGMDESFKHYQPAYLTWYSAIEESFNLGALKCNLGGINGDLKDGLLKFKKNFNPIIEEYCGEFNLRTSSILTYKLFMKLYEYKTR